MKQEANLATAVIAKASVRFINEHKEVKAEQSEPLAMTDEYRFLCGLTKISRFLFVLADIRPYDATQFTPLKLLQHFRANVNKEENSYYRNMIAHASEEY